MPATGALPPAAPIREVVVVGGAEEGVTTLAAGFARLGVTAGVVSFADTNLRGRLSAPRPDLVVVRAVSPEDEDAALRMLSAELEALRALSVPVLATCGPPAAPPTALHLLVDDVLLPPHSAAEALLRAALVMRRRGGSGRPVATAGPLTVDLEGYRVWMAGRPVSLTYTEFQMLRLLLLNRGKVLTRQSLLNKIWGYDYLGGLRTVDVHIRRLRAKIESDAPDLIETVRHVGYRIAE
jgi:two-component system, OmpR family, alkaline phosphatase synthesis response regulator PhoP